MILVLMASCEIFPREAVPGFLSLPEKSPVFEFDYVNSGSFPGWIKFQNRCVGIISYQWQLGVLDEDGRELTSFSSAPKIRYPRNGTYRVIVKGSDTHGMKFERHLSVEVSNY